MRPIGIGKVICHMIWKTILTTIGTDIKEATGALQFCAGQQVRCEATAHSMHLVYEDPQTEAAIFDVTNALQKTLLPWLLSMYECSLF